MCRKPGNPFLSLMPIWSTPIGTTLLLVGLTRQAGPFPLGEHLTGFVEHGLWGFQLCAILVKLQLVFHVLDLRDRQSTIQTRGYKHSPHGQYMALT